MPVYTNYSGELATKLDEFRTKGQKEAAAHRPATDSLRLDQNESALHAEAEKWLSNEQRLFDSVLGDASRAVVDSQQKAIELQNTVDQLLSDRSLLVTIEADMAEERNKLILATEKRMRAEVDLRHLRVENNISVQAVYPDSAIFHLAIIAALALIETGINTVFYENAQGLFGGFTVALGVAVVNMIGAVLLGFGFRFKNLKSVDNKILGYGCLFLFTVLTIYCNALFSAFRSEYQILTDPTDNAQVRQGFALAINEAKKVFVLNMHIADLSSFILFGLGIVLAGFAFYKGYTIDDKHPGYGKIDRLVKSLQLVEVQIQDLLRQKVKNFLHHRRADVQSALNEPSLITGIAVRRISELASAQALLRNQAATIQRDFSTVLGAYRNANAAVRATEPPSYFKEVPNLTDKVDGSAAAQYIEQLGKVQEEVKAFREKYQESLNLKLQKLQSDSASILSETFQDFIRETESEAQERINRTVASVYRGKLERTDA